MLVVVVGRILLVRDVESMLESTRLNRGVYAMLLREGVRVLNCQCKTKRVEVDAMTHVGGILWLFVFGDLSLNESAQQSGVSGASDGGRRG